MNMIQQGFKNIYPRFTNDIKSKNNQTVMFSEAPTQMPDTNVIQAWFKDDSFISDDYDVTSLQRKYVPSNRSNFTYYKKDSSDLLLSMPQKPEFTDPEVLDNRFRTQFKNNRFSDEKTNKKVEKPFIEKTDQNTWLSFFPSQTDSVKKILKLGIQKKKKYLTFYRLRENL